LQKHISRDFTFLFFKQKLWLKSIYIFGESCSSCYTEHKKIGFAIFGFFLRIDMDFTSFSQNTSKGKESFCEGVPGKTKQFTDLPLVCAKAPGNKTHPAIGSTGTGGGGGSPDSGEVGPTRAGEE
jgi:hypothetical protein